MADPTCVLFATIPDDSRLSSEGLKRLRESLQSVADQLPCNPLVVIGETGMTLSFVPLPGGTAPVLVPLEVPVDAL
jgi:hypothetical protein